MTRRPRGWAERRRTTWADRRPTVWTDRRVLWGLLAAGAIAWSLLQAGVLEGELLNPGGWVQVRRFLAAAVQPAGDGDFLRLTARASLVTLAFAVCGTALSLVIGVVGGLLGSEVWWDVLAEAAGGRSTIRRRAPWLAVRGALALPRAIHEIIWGLLFVAVLGLDPLVGILAIGIPYGAIVAKVFSEILDETPRTALRALRASGVRPLPAFLYSLVPQAVPDLLSYAFYRFECSIRSAAVLGIIGAGGLGYQILLSLQSLRYEQMWTLLHALILLTGLTDLWSGLLRRRLGSSHRVELGFRQRRKRPWHRRSRSAGKSGPGADPASEEHAARPAEGEGGPEGAGRGPAAADRPRRDPVVTGSFLLWTALLGVSLWGVDAGWQKLGSPRTAELAARTLDAAWPPSLGGLSLAGFVDLSLETLAMSVLAMALAGAGGLLLSFPAAHNVLLAGGILNPEGRPGVRSLAGALVFGATRLLLLVLRAIPAPIWALVLLFVFFPGILPGALALGIYTLGVLGRLMAEVTENLDARPLRALRAQGASAPSVFLYGVLPATAARNTAYLVYRWEVAIRATAMVGVVGAGGLGRLLQEQLSSFDYAAVTTTLLFYVALTFLVDLLSARVRRDVR